MQRIWPALLVCAACGARSEIAGQGGELLDASIDVNVGVDATQDGAAGDDAAGDAMEGCTPAQVAIGCAGPNGDCDTYGCKFNVEWTCGDTTFRAGGACTPPDAGAISGDGEYEGVCDENGAQTSTFTVDTTTCDCKAEQSLVTIVQGLCAHQ